jgi:oligopeptide transport system substrate-binding protein
MIVEDTESAQNVAQFIQSELQTNLEGLTINIETMPKKNRVERMQDGNFEIGLTRWGPDYADPMTYLDMWITGSPNNYGFWSNAEYDAIIQSAKKGEPALDPRPAGRPSSRQKASRQTRSSSCPSIRRATP